MKPITAEEIRCRGFAPGALEYMMASLRVAIGERLKRLEVVRQFMVDGFSVRHVLEFSDAIQKDPDLRQIVADYVAQNSDAPAIPVVASEEQIPA